MSLNANEREKIINQLDNSFEQMPTWAKTAVKHNLGAPKINPDTNQPFKSFKEVISFLNDDRLQTLKDDFIDNGDFIE